MLYALICTDLYEEYIAESKINKRVFVCVFPNSCMLVKMSSKTSSNSMALARRTVQQLRVEASIERIKVATFSELILSFS